MPPWDPMAARWQEAADDAATGALGSLRASAEKWSSTLATLLALGGTVFVLKGPATLAEVPNEAWRIVIFIGMAVSGLLAGIAVLLAAMAAQGSTPKLFTNWNGPTLERETTIRTEKAALQLRAARCLGMLAAVVVFVAGAIGVWFGVTPNASPQSVVVVVKSGAIYCGELAKSSNGEVTVGGVSVKDVSDVRTIASSCN